MEVIISYFYHLLKMFKRKNYRQSPMVYIRIFRITSLLYTIYYITVTEQKINAPSAKREMNY